MLQPLQYPHARKSSNSWPIHPPPRKSSLRVSAAVAVSRSPLSETSENWKTDIIDCFDGRYTTAPVEGINNKPRVITKRCHAINSAGTPWNRLILGSNRASEAVAEVSPSYARSSAA